MKNIKKCQKIREWITASLVDELSSSQEQILQEHLQECSECLNEYNEMKKILSLTTESLQSNKYSWSDKSVEKEYSTIIDINCLTDIFAEERQNIAKKRRLFAWRYGLPIAACLAIMAVSIDAVIEKYHSKDKTIAAASQNMSEDGNVLKKYLVNSAQKNIFTDTMVDVKDINFNKINRDNIAVIIDSVNVQLAKSNAPKLTLQREIMDNDAVVERRGVFMEAEAYGNALNKTSTVNKEYSAPSIIQSEPVLQDAPVAKAKMIEAKKARMKSSVMKLKKKAISNKITLQELLNKLQKQSVKWHYDSKKKQIIISYEQ